MYNVTVELKAEGDKKSIYELKEAILRMGAQHSCHCEISITSDGGFQETISASFNPIVELSSDDIVDLTLTGDEQYALLESKEKL